METLGICVVTGNNMTHVLGLATSARANGRKTDIFLTGDGVHLTQDPLFEKLVEVARVGICEVSYNHFGYDKSVAGLSDKNFVNQMRNAEMVKNCDRYIVL